MSKKDGTSSSPVAGNEQQLALRVSTELMDAIDREVDRLREERPGARVGRSDAVREILHQVLLADRRFADEAAKRRDKR